MKKQPGFFHWICIVFVSVLLIISLTLTATSAALYYKGHRIEDLKTEATVRLVFSEILSGEDPSLVESLEKIPVFKDAQTRYAYALLDWRYNKGPDWSGLTEEETRTISHELLFETLEKESLITAESLTSDPDYAEALEEHEKTLMNPMQNLFPSFKGVLTPALIRHLDSAASVVTGRIFIIAAFVSFVLLAVMFLFCRGFAEHSMPIALTLILAAALAFIFAVRADFFDIFGRIYPDYSLLKRPSDSVTGFLAIWAFAYLLLSIPFVVLSIRHFASVPDKEESPAPVPEPSRPAYVPVYSLSSDEPDYRYGDAEPAIPAFLSKPQPAVKEAPAVAAAPAAAADSKPEEVPAEEPVAEPVLAEEPQAAETAEEPVPEEAAAPDEAQTVPETAEEAEEDETENAPDESGDEDSSVEESPETPDEILSEPDVPGEKSAEAEKMETEDFILEDDVPSGEPEDIEDGPSDSEQDDALDAEEPFSEAEETAESSAEQEALPSAPAASPDQAEASAETGEIRPDDFYMRPGPLYGSAHSLSALEADASYDDGDFMSDLPLL